MKYIDGLTYYCTFYRHSSLDNSFADIAAATSPYGELCISPESLILRLRKILCRSGFPLRFFPWYRLEVEVKNLNPVILGRSSVFICVFKRECVFIVAGEEKYYNVTGRIIRARGLKTNTPHVYCKIRIDKWVNKKSWIESTCKS